MTIQIHDPHDRLFRNFLADINKAKDFLETYLQPNIKKQCDFSTLNFKPGSFVEKDLKHHFSDILYSVKIADTEGYIYTLIEHETTPSKLTPFKLLRYQIAIMKQHLDQGNKTLPIVIPLLFYRGKKSPYPFTTNILDCFDSRELAEETFLKPYPLIDVTIIPDDELRKHKGIAILELVQKNIHQRDALEFIKDIALQIAKKLLTHEQFKSLLYYITQEGESKNFEQFYSTLAETLPNYREDIMTLAQQLEQKGLRQGREIERYDLAKSLLAEGISLDVIKKVTKLPDLDLIELEKA
ncbi:Rpn family recombination-promoting nuclease/putative transposase [Rickettsiella endosymbiont of Dermanyssus gallinae]|uniref:Rpn family recombination-promoting nuclease/putative transposase n=1 Tax=Rickettsiella endosymbiont of Dermanyssus gallinae TaxID=2856608 RepID=UPI001C52C549|nr:Rpn family recombination-promoting nuclease/putative transposase [Rickettsiella endosymbiont of Dermanyssus gallinae]